MNVRFNRVERINCACGLRLAGKRKGMIVIMYDLERTKKTIAAMFCLSAVSLILAFVGFAGGGEELIRYGIMNNPGHTILMFTGAGTFVISLLVGIGFKSLSKDIAEVLKSMENRK